MYMHVLYILTRSQGGSAFLTIFTFEGCLPDFSHAIITLLYALMYITVDTMNVCV